ncbi:mucin-binding protein [Lactiplantibacillus daowaiensis]|uniref:MucBP domain-containing protein n=1 Tax=Lactiplantibacillus daowaiensis TaxID=2559918 RepID=A0ABW1RZR3_9LACO|nr:MucBP domain-containing protein [Lactiplantibacillus daowaiensis]
MKKQRQQFYREQPMGYRHWLYTGLTTLLLTSPLLVMSANADATDSATTATDGTAKATATTTTEQQSTSKSVTLKSSGTQADQAETASSGNEQTSSDSGSTGTGSTSGTTEVDKNDAATDKETTNTGANNNQTTDEQVVTDSNDSTVTNNQNTGTAKSDADNQSVTQSTAKQTTDDQTVNSNSKSTDTTTQPQKAALTRVTPVAENEITTTGTVNVDNSGTGTSTSTGDNSGSQTGSTTTTTTTVPKIDYATAPDSQVVTFADANLAAVVRRELKVAADQPITLGDIRHGGFGPNPINIVDETNIITSLAGIEALQELPSKNKVRVIINIAAGYLNDDGQLISNNFDLTPLSKLQLSTLSLTTPYLSVVDLTPLNQLDVSALQTVELVGVGARNRYGMTNQQLAGIADWLTEYLNYDYRDVHGKKYGRTLSLQSNNLTDLSVLKNANPERYNMINVWQQFYVSSDTLNAVAGAPVQILANQQIGMQGEQLYTTNLYSFGSSLTSTKPVSLATNLGDGQYQIDGLTTADGWVTYGPKSYADHNIYYDPSGASDTTQLLFSLVVANQINWTDPTIKVNYIDKTTGETIKATETLGANQIVGDTVDLSDKTILAGYDYIGTDADSLNLTYTANPQTVNLYFTKQQIAAGAVKVQYVDTEGNILATGTATYPNGQQVGEQYTTQTKAIDGYSFDHVDSNGLAATGTLTADGGTVTYVYTKNVAETGQAKVVYMDDTTGKTLATEVLTGDVGTTSDYQTAATIKTYTDRGYELVMDEYPSNGVIFDTNTPTYLVHLKHQISTVTDSKTVTETIHYVYADGKTAATDYQAQLAFKRTGSRDLVTWITTWGDWTADKTSFDAQTSPLIAGYQADQATVKAVNAVTADSQDIDVTVTYTAKSTTPDTTKPVTLTAPDTIKPDAVVKKVQADPSFEVETWNSEIMIAPDKKHGNTDAKTTRLVISKIDPQPAMVNKGEGPKSLSQQAAKDTNQLPKTAEKSTSTLVAMAGSLFLALLGIGGYRHKQ